MISSINMSSYLKIARLNSQIDNFISQALLIKSKLSSIPLMENGVGQLVNITA